MKYRILIEKVYDEIDKPASICGGIDIIQTEKINKSNEGRKKPIAMS